MNRCSKPVFALFFIACSAILALAGAAFSPEAQAQRLFPQQVERGKISFTGLNEVLLNDRPERLAPGARVRTEQNTIALSGTLQGKSFVVNYLRDPAGLVRDIWILTPDEAARELPGQSATRGALGPGAYAN